MSGAIAMLERLGWASDPEDPQFSNNVRSYHFTRNDIDRRMAKGPDFSTVAVSECCGKWSELGVRSIQARFDRVIGILDDACAKQKRRADDAWVWHCQRGCYPAGAD